MIVCVFLSNNIPFDVFLFCYQSYKFVTCWASHVVDVVYLYGVSLLKFQGCDLLRQHLLFRWRTVQVAVRLDLIVVMMI